MSGVTFLVWSDAVAVVDIYQPASISPNTPILSVLSLRLPVSQHQCEQSAFRQLYHQTLCQTCSPCSALPSSDRSSNKARAKGGKREKDAVKRESKTEKEERKSFSLRRTQAETQGGRGAGRRGSACTAIRGNLFKGVRLLTMWLLITKQRQGDNLFFLLSSNKDKGK